ncbi:MAG: FRG domain-containing protein [Terracidiphilus sp.]|jgi:hypothetical protein
MSEEPGAFPKPRLLSIRKHLEAKGDNEPFTNLTQFLSHIHQSSSQWQKDDWKRRENDEGDVLNPVRIVGRVWFRGQRNPQHGLQPSLYREDTWKHLKKDEKSPRPDDDSDGKLFSELFNLEHELRIDFTSFGHLLNEANHAKTPIDWYFLMQHHSLPTRLLDWTTNALAALFFALEDYRNEVESTTVGGEQPSVVISVWMMDAYWLADRLSSDWRAPILAWSEDAARYVPPLETLVDKMDDSQALVPSHAMPIEPPAMHPRVASQEGRFVIFGRERDLLDEKIRLEPLDDCERIEELRLEQIKMQVNDVDDLMQDLAQLGVSRRTLFPDLAGLADFIQWKHFHKVRGYKL